MCGGCDFVKLGTVVFFYPLIEEVEKGRLIYFIIGGVGRDSEGGAGALAKSRL